MRLHLLHGSIECLTPFSQVCFAISHQRKTVRSISHETFWESADGEFAVSLPPILASLRFVDIMYVAFCPLTHLIAIAEHSESG